MNNRTDTLIDFTVGNYTKKLIAFAIPILLSELLQGLYNSVDSLVIGNYVGSDALAAVSVCSPLVSLFVGFFVGLSAGATVVISHAFSARESIKQKVGTIYTVSIVVGLVVTLASVVLSPLLLSLMMPPQEVYAEALRYFRIYIVGLTFTVVFNVCSGILRALGDSRSPLRIMAITSMLNIVLDLLFVRLFTSGILGVSVATVCAQLCSMLLITVQLYRRCPFALEWDRAEKTAVVRFLKIGIPAGMQNTIIALSNLFVWKYIGMFGVVELAGVGVVHKIDRFITIPAKSISTAITTLVAHNMGAEKPERAKLGSRDGVLIILAITAVLQTVVYVLCGWFAGFFTKDLAVIAIVVAMLRMDAPFYVFISMRDALSGVLRGYGNSFVPMLLSLFGMIGVRQTYLMIAMHVRPEIEQVYRAYPLAWVFTAIFMMAYMYLFFRRNKGKLGAQPADQK